MTDMSAHRPPIWSEPNGRFPPTRHSIGHTISETPRLPDAGPFR